MSLPPLPRRLQAGSTVGLIAPASAPLDPQRLEDGIRTLESRGLTVVRSRELRPEGYLSGSDEARADELNRMIARADVDVLLCVRGGYGVLRLLDRIDYASARRHRKLVVGYSDITALQMALFARAGWTGLSGPMASVEWPEPDPHAEARFWELVGGRAPLDLDAVDGSTMRTVRPGRTEGVLLGGNLSMLARLCGTPYLPDLEGALLVLEDVGEAPYRIDAYLAQLRLAGHLDRLGGVILGGFTEIAVPRERPTRSLEAVFDDYFASAPYPVVEGFNYGHFPRKTAVPLGVRAVLDADASPPRLTVLDPITSG